MLVATAGTWVRFAIAHTLRIDTAGGAFLVGSAISGAGLIVAGVAALQAAREAWALRELIWTSIAMQIVSLVALPLTTTDVYTYLAHGSLELAGLSPYAHTPGEIAHPFTAMVPDRWAHELTAYGPLFQPIAALATWAGRGIGSPVWGALFGFKLLLTVITIGALLLAARSLRSQPETFALLALSPLVAWEISSQAHNDGLLFAALIGFAVAAQRDRAGWATVALAVGTAVKYATAPLLALYLLLVARRDLRKALLLGALALGVLAVAFLPELRFVSVRTLLPMFGADASRHAHSFTDMVCLALRGLGWDRGSAASFRILSAVSAALCAALLVRAAFVSRTLAQLNRAWLWFLFGLYLTAAWFQPWYVVWALPALLLEPDPRWRRFVALFAVVSVAQWIVPLDPFTTVAADIWAAVRLWRLSRPAPSTASTLPAAAA